MFAGTHWEGNAPFWSTMACPPKRFSFLGRGRAPYASISPSGLNTPLPPAPLSPRPPLPGRGGGGSNPNALHGAFPTTDVHRTIRAVTEITSLDRHFFATESVPSADSGWSAADPFPAIATRTAFPFVRWSSAVPRLPLRVRREKSCDRRHRSGRRMNRQWPGPRLRRPHPRRGSPGVRKARRSYIDGRVRRSPDTRQPDRVRGAVVRPCA